MPELSQATVVVIIVVALFIIVALVMGRRLKRFTFKAGGASGSAEGADPGSNLVRNKVEGDDNKAKVEGSNATIADNKIKGNRNEFGAKSGRA